MVRIKKEIDVITPETQYGNITGVLNNVIKPVNESSLGDLKDVIINDLKENDVLTYTGEKWVNVPIYEVTDKYEWNVDGNGSKQDENEEDKSESEEDKNEENE